MAQRSPDDPQFSTLDLFTKVQNAAHGDGIPDDVWRQFERVTLEVIESGRHRYSAKAIMERVRWHREIEQRAGEFKCNNNWTAKLARRFMDAHPEYRGFFETRTKRNDGWR